MNRTLWGILIALFLYVVPASTEEHSATPPGYQWQNIPVVCASNEQVMRDLEAQGYQLLSLSLGRKGASPEGEPVFMVSYYFNEKAESTAAVMNIPSSKDACIIFLTYDLVLNTPAN